jgi:hypothetical protein
VGVLVLPAGLSVTVIAAVGRRGGRRRCSPLLFEVGAGEAVFGGWEWSWRVTVIMALTLVIVLMTSTFSERTRDEDDGLVEGGGTGGNRNLCEVTDEG